MSWQQKFLGEAELGSARHSCYVGTAGMCWRGVQKTLAWPRRDQGGQKGPDAAFQGCWKLCAPQVPPRPFVSHQPKSWRNCPAWEWGVGQVLCPGQPVLSWVLVPPLGHCCDNSQCFSRSLTKTQTASEHALLCCGAEGPVQPQPWLSTMLIRFVQAARSHPAVHNFNCLLHNCLSNICSVMWHDLPAKLQQE